MFNKFKTTTLAAITAAATLLGSGQAWALQNDSGTEIITFGTCDLYRVFNTSSSALNTFVYINGGYAGGTKQSHCAN